MRGQSSGKELLDRGPHRFVRCGGPLIAHSRFYLLSADS
jgi:hypothetical protein